MAKDPVTEAALQKRVAVLESEVKTLRFCVEHHTHVATSDLWTGAPKMSPQLEQITPPALDLGEVETIVRDVLDWLDGRGVWSPHAVNDYVAQYLVAYAARKGANDERR